MKKLSSTKLSKAKLSKTDESHLQEMDIPIPLSIKDLVPQGKVTTNIETGKDQGFWTGLLEKKK